MTKALAVIAKFSSPHALLHAATRLRDQGYTKIEAYSPFPIHGLDEVLNIPPSPLGWIALAGGIGGGIFGFGLQAWVAMCAYPLRFSGKPLFSFQNWMPVTIGFILIGASFAVFFGMLALSRLPEWHHGIFRYSAIGTASDDGFLLSISVDDPFFDETLSPQVLTGLGGKFVEFIS